MARHAFLSAWAGLSAIVAALLVLLGQGLAGGVVFGIALGLAAAGADVVVSDLPERRTLAEGVQRRIEQMGRRSANYTLDVGDLAATWHEQLALWLDEAITDGVRKSKMPAFKEKLTPEEIKSMVPYLRAFAGKK